MNAFLDRFAEPGLWFLAEWSLRWAVPIAAMAVVLTVWPPRRAATRHLLGVLVLGTGLLLPLVPRWGPGLWGPDRATGAAEVASVPLPVVGPIVPDGPRIANPTLPSLPPVATASIPIAPEARIEPLGFRRWVVLGLSVAYATVVCLLISRLLVGRWFVVRMLREAIPTGKDSAGLLASCSAEVGLRRRVSLAVHPEIGSPVAIGGRTPIVLVPADWIAQPVNVRRACLLHEMTHLVRRDDWSKWGMELVRVAFCFHPMVLWLLARLDREREVLCDEAAIARGVDPREYARMLLEFARRPVLWLAPGALPFFEKSTVLLRIEHLLEDDMKRWITPLPIRRALAMSGVVLTIALGLGSARVVALTPNESVVAPAPAPAPVPEPPAALPVVAPVAEEDPSVRIQGKVIDAETRQPISRFVVQDGRPDPQDPSRIVWGWSEGRIESDNPDGTIRETLSGKGSWKRVFADGYLPQPITAKPYDGETGTIELVVALRRGKQIVGRVLDQAKQPVSGVSVFLVGGRASSNITGGQALRSMVGGEDQTVTRTTTDPKGRFTLTGAGSDATTVAVSAPKLDLWVVPAPPDGKELEITLPEAGKMVIRYDIEGAEPEATFFLQLLREGREGWNVVENLREPKVKNQGRIVLENLTAGTYDLSRFQKNLRVGDIGINPFLDRQNVVVEAGKTTEIAFVRQSGSTVSGVIVGLKELKLPGAFVMVNLGDEVRDGKPARFSEKPVEALTCDESGRFTTPRLLPDTYTIVAEGYTPETPEQRRRMGWRVADQRAFAVVTVPKDGPAPAVRIEMPKPKPDEKAVEKK